MYEYKFMQICSHLRGTIKKMERELDDLRLEIKKAEIHYYEIGIYSDVGSALDAWDEFIRLKDLETLLVKKIEKVDDEMAQFRQTYQFDSVRQNEQKQMSKEIKSPQPKKRDRKDYWRLWINKKSRDTPKKG